MKKYFLVIVILIGTFIGFSQNSSEKTNQDIVKNLELSSNTELIFD